MFLFMQLLCCNSCPNPGRLIWTAFWSSHAVQNSTNLPKLLKFAPQKPQNGVVCFWIHKKKNSISCQCSFRTFFHHSLLSVAITWKVVALAVVRMCLGRMSWRCQAAATATTAGVVSGNWSWVESIELPVLTKARTVTASSLTLCGTGGRATYPERDKNRIVVASE